LPQALHVFLLALIVPAEASHRFARCVDAVSSVLRLNLRLATDPSDRQHSGNLRNFAADEVFLTSL
jgi:hypothetical protein